MTRYQVLTLVTVVGALVLVAVGSAVRTTGSGLGCPDWPLCHGQLLPPLEREALFEWSHRTVAAIVGLLIAAQAVWTLAAHRADRALASLAVAALPLLALLAYLGRRAVLGELPAATVALHMLLALTLVSLLALVAAYALLGPERRRIETPEHAVLRRLALLTTVVVAGVMVVGAYAVATHAGFACLGWPDCPQARIPFAEGGRLQHIHWLHRLTVVAGLVAVLALAYHVREMREARSVLRKGASTLAGIYLLQILVGAGNIWSDFSELVRVAHLTLAAVIMALAVVIAAAGVLEPSGSGGPPARARAARSRTRPTGRTANGPIG